MRHIFTTFVLLFVAGICYGQVQIKLKQPPMNQLGVKDMWNVTVRNISTKEVQLLLRGTADEAQDGRLVDGKTGMFTLKANETRIMSGSNIPGGGSYSWQNKKFQEAMLRSGNAPSGNYTICVYAESESGSPLGQDCFQQNIALMSPPTLISPSDGENIPQSQQPLFTWLPPAPAPQGATYTLRMVELIGNQSAIDAMAKNSAVFEQKELRSTSLQYPISARKLEAGKKYAWQVSSGEMRSESWLFTMEIGKNLSNESANETNAGNPQGKQACTKGTYPNPSYPICGEPCQPCLGCCPCPGRPGEYCDLITGNFLPIKNIHPDAYLNDHVYFDGKIIPVELVDLSKGGTVLMQLVDSFDSLQVVPSYLAGEEVIINAKGKEIARTKIGKNGEYIFTLPPGFKKLEDINVVLPSAKMQPGREKLCWEILKEMFDRKEPGWTWYSSESDLALWTNKELVDWADHLRCNKLKAFIPTKSPDMNPSDFPITTLPKFDKDQVRITETQDFTWTTPELLAKMGYKSLTFAGGIYTIKKSNNGGIYTVELPVVKGVKLDGTPILSKGTPQQCHTANYDCKGIGFSCLVMFPDQSQNNCRLTPIIENNEIVRVKLEYGTPSPQAIEIGATFTIGRNKYNCGRFAICTIGEITDVHVELDLRSEYGIRHEPQSGTTTLLFPMAVLLNKQPDKIEFLENKSSVHFADKWVAPEKINKLLHSKKPIVIEEGDYPVSFSNGVYSMIAGSGQSTSSGTTAFVTTLCYNSGTTNHPTWDCQTHENWKCSDIWGQWYHDGMTCTEQYYAKPPKIIVFDNGKSFIDNNGEVTQIASDKLHLFITKTAPALSKEDFRIQMNNVLKNNDGMVSKERLASIAKALNATVIKMGSDEFKGQNLLTPLNRPVSDDEKIIVVSDDPVSLSLSPNSKITQIGLGYQIMSDNNNKLYAVPIPLLGGLISPEIFEAEPWLQLGCKPPCMEIGIAGKCGKFCYRLLKPDISSLPSLSLQHDSKFFLEKNIADGAVLTNIDGKIRLTSILNTSQGRILLSSEGVPNEPQQILTGGGWCGCYITGLGRALAFRHDFSGSCEEACKWLNGVYDKHPDWFSSTYILPNDSGHIRSVPTTSPKSTTNGGLKVRIKDSRSSSITLTISELFTIINSLGQTRQILDYRIVSNESGNPILAVECFNKSENTSEKIGFELIESNGGLFIVYGGTAQRCSGCANCATVRGTSGHHYVWQCNTCVDVESNVLVQCLSSKITLNSPQILQAFEEVINNQARGVQTDDKDDTELNTSAGNKSLGGICKCCRRFVNPETHDYSLCCELAKPKIQNHDRSVQPDGSNDSDPKFPNRKKAQYSVTPNPGVGITVNHCCIDTQEPQSIQLSNSDIATSIQVAEGISQKIVIKSVISNGTPEKPHVLVSYTTTKGESLNIGLDVIGFSDDPVVQPQIQGRSAQAPPVRGIGVVVKHQGATPSHFIIPGEVVNEGRDETSNENTNIQARGVQPDGSNDSDPSGSRDSKPQNLYIDYIKGINTQRSNERSPNVTLPTPPLGSVPTYGAGSIRPLLCKCCGASLTDGAHDATKCCSDKESKPKVHYTNPEGTPVRGKIVKTGTNPNSIILGGHTCKCCGDDFSTTEALNRHDSCCMVKDANPKMHYRNPDGTLKYFEYTSDYVITDKKLCEAFGVKELVIAPGVYHIEYSDQSHGGVVRLRLKSPIPAKQIRIKEPITIEGTNPKGKDCKGAGNSCFFYSDTMQSIRKLPKDSCIFTVAPLMPDTTCLVIEVSFRGTGSPKSAGF